MVLDVYEMDDGSDRTILLVLAVQLGPHQGVHPW